METVSDDSLDVFSTDGHTDTSDPGFIRTMSSPAVSFSHGVASGDPYADSVILWTRITPPAEFSGLVDVQWELASSADFAAGSLIDSGTFATSADRDWTVKVEADGLTADTGYYYRFRSGDAVSQVGTTKTLPVDSDPVRLAVFSCANFTAAEQFAAYGRAAEIHAVNPYDALLHLGDYIYEYGPGGYGTAEDAASDRGFLPEREIINLDDYRQRYAQYHTDLNLQSLRAVAPLIGGWDDHETANNSWSGGAQNHQSETEGDWIARRDAALQAYYEWLPIREPAQRQASDGATALSPLTQAYRSFNFGDVLSLHMLETRLTARDEQLAYPAPAAVQARIGAILADPAQVAAYAVQLSLTPPTDPAAIPAFAAALAPAVTQELVVATVQQAWGDPSRDMIGDSQLAWLQQQLATSPAAWQVLGQQTLMQSMAVPAELLLNAGDPTLLDKYAAPLQKLATGTAFADLTPAEQALFAEAGKIPYNLDAWDGYGVERETILQSALALGKRLISLAGDTHNAWAGVLDTMSPGTGTQPPGTVAGVEFGAPGVTSPGLERVLAGADAYIRAFYPAVDGLDGLFMGYVNGLTYADTNRRGFLDLTVSKEEAIGNYQFLDGVNPQSGQTQWASETVVAASDLSLSLEPEASPEIRWQPLWSELDLVFGLATDTAGGQTLLDPADYATLPRAGVQLADVTVLGSEADDRIFAGVGSLVDGAGGGDTLFNSDSQGDNQLVGGLGGDQLFLRPVHDQVIGGQLFSDAAAFGLPLFTALVDRERDSFLIDGGDPGTAAPLQILDYEPLVDQLLVDGVAPAGAWAAVRQELQALNVTVNAAPQLSATPITIPIQPGTTKTLDLSPFASDADGDSLQLLKLSGPTWISATGTSLSLTAPADLSAEQLAATELVLAFSDGQAVADFAPALSLAEPPPPLPVLAITATDADRPEGNAGATPFSFTVTRAGDTTATSTVAWSLASSGSAPADDLDFSGGTLPAGTLTFSPGQTSQIVSIEVAGDTEVEADEAFTVSLATPTGAELDSAASAAAGIIRNDDTPPTPLPVLRISASEADRPEGNAGSTPFSFTVSRSGDTTGVSRATWTVGRSEAPTVNAADFAGSGFARGQVRFQAGETEQTIRVSVQGDLDEEANERFSVTLSAPSGANLARAAVTGTIRNDDLIGTARADRLRGSDAPEFIDGLAGQDSLTGGRGPDLFGFGFGDSSLRTPDLITDFRFGDDRIAIFRSNSDTPATPDRFSRAANNRTAATLTDLAAAVFADADGQRRGDQPLGATAAAFVVSTNRAIAGAYLLINDNRATAQLSSDLMVNISGATGPLPAPGANPVGALFA